MRAAIIGVIDAATEQFGEDNPARVDQLVQTANTALMAIDALFTEVPYRV
jgi:hypothetical protein